MGKQQVEFWFWCIYIMFTILQWNAQSLKAHGNELKKFIYEAENKPDIMCIQETWLTEKMRYSIPGYDIIRKDRIKKGDGNKNPRGGCCIFVRKGLAVSVVPVSHENLEMQMIEVWTGNMSKIFIVNVYNPCVKWENNWLDDIVKKRESKTLICGDFNAHNGLWGSEKTDKNGSIVEEIIDDLNLVCLNTGEGTRLDPITGKFSAIDITLCPPSMAGKCIWEVLKENWGSDHFPIVCSYGIDAYYSKTDSQARWSFQKADWVKFDQCCSERLTFPNELDDINFMYNNFINQITQSANDSIPKTKNNWKNKSSTPWWNEDCKAAVGERKKAMNKLKRNSTPQNLDSYKKAKAHAKRTIIQAKKENWRKFCSSITSDTHTTKIWSNINCINRTKTRNSIPVLKKDQNNLAVTDLDKANMLASSFAQVSSDDNYNDSFRDRKQKMESDYNHLEGKNFVLDEPFSMKELEAAITKANCTTPGKDGISMRLIKKFSPHVLLIMLYIFNVIWEKGICPNAWKEAILTPLPKPGKDHSDPLSYRPIALTSVIGKVMERMINKRILWYLESKNLLDHIQSGFRKTRRTTDHLVSLENSINKGFANKESTVAIFLDIQKAYDMVWRRGVLIKMKAMGICGRTLKWVDSFMSNRVIQVKINGILSDKFITENGVPQGSVISPLLFNIAVSDIPRCIQGINISQFADDIAIWKTSRSIKFATKKVQTGLTDIVNWCNKWGFTLSVPKTVGILFTKKKNIPDLDVKIGNNKVKFKQETKFLGLVFDTKLNWNKHFEYLLDRCKKRLNLLRCMTGHSWGIDGSLLLRLYKALIRPILDYGCEAYDSTCNTNKKSLDTIQYRALKLCTGAIHGTSLRALQIECGEPPLGIRRKFLTDSYGAVIKANPNHPNKHMFCDNWQKHYFFQDENPYLHKPFESRVIDIDFDMMETVYPEFPFWDFQEIKINTSLHNLIQGIEEDHIKREIVIKEINSLWGAAVHIYTDGSLDPKTNKVGCSMVIPAFKVSKKFRLSNNSSIYSAELVAILMALEWIEEVKPTDAIVFSDCKSAITAIGKFDQDNKVILDIQRLYNSLKSQSTNVEIIWIPSHIGIYGNEWADLAAKKASERKNIDINLKLNKAEIKREFKTRLKDNWQKEWDTYPNNNITKKVRPQVCLYMNNWNIPREWEISMHRLRLGKCRQLNDFLYTIGKHPDGKCNLCGIKDNVEHFILECKKYDAQRLELKNDLRKIGVKNLSIGSILGGKTPPVAEIMKFINKCKIKI